MKQSPIKSAFTSNAERYSNALTALKGIERGEREREIRTRLAEVRAHIGNPDALVYDIARRILKDDPAKTAGQLSGLILCLMQLVEAALADRY